LTFIDANGVRWWRDGFVLRALDRNVDSTEATMGYVNVLKPLGREASASVW
jgi:hypothetical protein